MSDFNSLIEVAEDDKQSSYRRRQAVTDLLKRHPEEAQTLKVVETLLSGDDVSLQRDIVGALKDSPHPRVLPVLKPLLSIDDDYLRRDAIQVIGRIGSKEEVALIEELTGDSSFTVSYAAKSALSDINRRLDQEHVVEVPEPEVTEEQVVENEVSEPEEAGPSVEDIPDEPKDVLEPETDKEDDRVEETEEIAESEKSEEESVANEEASEPVEEVKEEAQDKSDEKEESSKPSEPVEEMKPHEQKLPSSLHDNSIYGEESIEDVNKKVSDEIESEISEKAPILTSSTNADNSSNLKSFFDEESHLALALYKQLATYSDELPAKEAVVSETKRQLTLLEADKADDVEASKESIKSEQGDVDEVKWQLKKAKKDLNDYEKENESVLSSLMFMFSADKKDEVVAEKAKLQKKIRELKQQLSNEEEELSYHKTEKKALLQPIIDLRKQLDVKMKDRDAVIEKVVGAERDINELITRLLLDSNGEKLKQRLSFLQKSHYPMARLATEKIISLVSKVRNEELNVEKLQEKYEESVNGASDQLVALGDELSKCLVRKETSVKKEVSVKVSVGFREEESFFSFSNASGSASGSGVARGTMKVEELLWRESPNLKGSIDSYAKGFHDLGAKAAERELGEIAYSSSYALLNSYIDYLRTLIEADFGE